MAMSNRLTVLSPPVAGCRASVTPVILVVSQNVLQRVLPVYLTSNRNRLLALAGLALGLAASSVATTAIGLKRNGCETTIAGLWCPRLCDAGCWLHRWNQRSFADRCLADLWQDSLGRILQANGRSSN